MLREQATFNLLDQPWIPCVLDLGEQPRFYSLREALEEAPAIHEIADPSPLVTVALHRLLLAILHRTFGPRDLDDWGHWWGRGAWDREALRAYLAEWHARFDLFDETFPFYQSRSLDFSYAIPAAKLTHELASGNNATLFDHTTEGIGTTLAPATAARYLVALQAFAIGGLVSLEKGQDTKLYKSAKAAPLTKGAVALVRGRNLFETLMLNWHAYNSRDGEPFAFVPEKDVPAWERAAETRAEDRLPDGYLDLLTWQSRRIRLKPEQTAAGEVVVRQVVVMKGNQFPDGYERQGQETMLAFRRNAQAKPGQEAWPVIAFQEDRALWRDSLTLLQSVDEERSRPDMLEWLSELVAIGTLDRATTMPVEFAGLSTDRGKIFFWRRELLPLPLEYLQSDELFEPLASGLETAESAGRLFLPGYDAVRIAGESKRLPRPCQVLGEALLSSSDARQPPAEVVRKLIEHLAPGRRYWSQLETPFRRFIVDLSLDKTMEEGEWVYGRTALPVWTAAVGQAARRAFREAIGSFDTSARGLKAAARAEREFERRLGRIIGGRDRAASAASEPGDAESEVGA
jgi:CRISPR system Cascade subunit CasA